jgi:hypothetical protein
MKTSLVALSLLSLAGCAPVDSQVSSAEEAICTPGQPGCPRLPRTGEESQGRSLSGDVYPEGLHVNPSTFSLGGVTASQTVVLRGTLFAKVGADWVGGAKVKDAWMEAVYPGATTPVKLHITDAVVSTDDPENDTFVKNVDPAGTTYLYSVSYVDQSTGEEKPLCNVDTSWDVPTGHVVNSQRAFVMPLWYDGKGSQQMGAMPSPLVAPPSVSPPTAKAFAFACRSGVSAKCYKWGYMPWLQPDPAQPSQLTQVHWACTRAARADYCGDGTSHTLQDTPVNIWDNVSPNPIKVDDVNPWVNPIGGIVVAGTNKLALAAKPVTDQFEGGWGQNGAICFSHLRWNNLPANLCADLEHSPFVTYDPIDGILVNHVCDSQAEAEQLAAMYQSYHWPVLTPRIFNESDLNAVVMPTRVIPPVAIDTGVLLAK